MGLDRELDVQWHAHDIPSTVQQRAGGVLASLAQVAEFDAAWISVSDQRLMTRPVLASRGLRRHEIDVLHDSLTTPPGLRRGSHVVLHAPGDSFVGLLELLHRGDRPPSEADDALLARHAPAIAEVLSPMRSLLHSVRMAPGASAGVALLQDGTTCVLPGLHDHALLKASSPAVQVASASLRAGHAYRSFLWITDEDVEARAHARLTVLAAPELPGLVRGTILLTPRADCRGLTPRELEVLGLLVDGRSNQEIAHRLAVAPRTVATHVEHVMRKLQAPSRTLAAVLAERDGCYVPAGAPAHHVTASDETPSGRTRLPSS